MGQKVNPISLRLGINRTWNSCWYDKKNFALYLHQDFFIRSYIKKTLPNAAITKVLIERIAKKIKITVRSARPGMVIGKKGSDIDKVKKCLTAHTGCEVSINIVEVRKPETDAQYVADSIAHQLERRVSFRKAMKKAMQSCLKFGAKGIRVNCSGRLGGAEIARMEWYREGRVPLHTLRANIDYAISRANTTYGVIGVRVIIYKPDEEKQQ
jgi:small subunit ribosomal protein S3